MPTMTTPTAIAEYNPIAAGLADLRTRYENVAWDLRTVKGNNDARAARKELVSLRTGLEAKRKELKEPVLERAKLIDSEAKRITAELLKIEMPIDEQIKADEARRETERREREAAEAKRVAAIMVRINAIASMPADLAGRSWIVIENAIQDLQNAPKFDFAEFAEQADSTTRATVVRLNELADASKAAEDAARKLAEERAELARQQAEAKRLAEVEDAKIAEEQRIERERLAAERKEMERQQAAERARIAAEQAEAARVLAEQQRIERDRIEAERAEQARKDAEVRRIQAERDRIDREARAAEQAKIDAENKRVADELAQQQAKIDAQRAEIERAAREQQEREHAAAQAQADKEAAAKKAVTAADPARPTDVQIVELLAGHYRVHPVEVIGWLRGIDFAALAPDLLSLAA